MMFKELKRGGEGGEEAESFHNVPENKTKQKKKTKKSLKRFWGRGQLFADFRFPRRFLEPNPSE
jgi:hypothetical protein